jgi:23S rRNA (uracil1939-C5)-methyltransferase
MDESSNHWKLRAMFSKGQRIEIAITDAADGQKCFGELDGGMAVFVHGAVAVGDRVEAEIFKVKKNYLEAGLRRVIAPSPVRVVPRCAHFGVCGGCKWQHVDYAEQLRMKRKIVADALEHLGGFSGIEVAATVGAEDPFHYRNKVEFSFGDARYLLDDERTVAAGNLVKPRDYALGFHAANLFSKVVDIDRCHIATEEMNAGLTLAKEFFRARKTSVCSNFTHTGFLRNLVFRHTAFTRELMVYLITSSQDEALMNEFLGALREAFGEKLTTFVNGITQRKNSVAFAEELRVLHGPGFITERLGACRFAISPNSFFQTNSRQALRLYEIARSSAALSPSDVLHDLYCGTGSIGIFCAGSCRRIIGFELDAGSVRDAMANAKLNGVGNAEFHEIDMRHLAAKLDSVERADVVITDPPRAGMHEKAVEALRVLAPRRIVYVSCNPASLARDAKALCEGGAYRLSRVQPVDLFPHTYHVESVATLELISG